MTVLKDKVNKLIKGQDLEKDFDKRVSIIFPTNSPVSAMSGESDVETPEPMGTGIFSKISQAIKKRLSPLISAKKNMDDVYSKGYFERHYPDADKNMKGLLHEHAMSSWAHAMDDSPDNNHDEEAEGESPHQITLTININK